MTRDELRKAVLHACLTRRISYAIVASMLGVTRGVVSGIVWRHQNPSRAKHVTAFGFRGGNKRRRNKSYWPKVWLHRKRNG